MSRDTSRVLLNDVGLPDRAMRIPTTQPAEGRRDAVPRVHATEQVQEHGFERLLTPAELADQWALSLDTVRRLFEREPDVLGFAQRRPGRPRSPSLRIPLSGAERIYRRRATRLRPTPPRNM